DLQIRLTQITGVSLQGHDNTVFEDYAEETTVGIFTSRRHEAQSKPDDIGIILEGQVVIQELDNVPLAISLLFGLLYALNMDYPPQLRYFFEVVQKVIMELDGGVLSRKAQVLKIDSMNIFMKV
uniref:Uncharacterized protein n=1 Tax=Amphiprion percula TaxID=161767 RepID=A0A3P8SGQ8_AMPPE